MTEKFTTEPWEISDMSCYDAMDNYTVCFHIGVSSTGEMIADLQSNDKADYERVKANAYLMKSAPEMYRMLEQLHGALSKVPILQREIEKLLKKARGE